MNDKHVNKTDHLNTEDAEVAFKEIKNDLQNDRQAKNARATSMLDKEYPRINTDNL
ncbi:hypothetical protein BN1058_01845 [Paraliobacillus sp. PM-2]|uniref:hypothetical protein n=1 Tax=Paraliobacillus sp. PM-2 TaxID=1462524 RepID=UPI00061BEC69|nr:hypothetical protein [Paraliobacillus sp. PM-2]CQR47522.1 hypothetical protein BN1058_01845 [Paraliobacillus sp. PM-2]